MDKSRRCRLLMAAAAVCLVSTGALVAPGAGATPRQAAARGEHLPDLIPGHDRPTHGRAALELLGDRLPEAARRNGMTADRLRGILAGDPTAWLDDDARLLYREPAASELAAEAEAAPSPTLAQAAAPYPLNQTFLLHSKAGSQRTIYLDFDGQDVRNTVWNGPGYGLAPGSHPAWSLDSNHSSFSSTEREEVQNVWQRVAQDYAPFDVDVTTQDPGAAALTRTDSSDMTFGTRALISPSAKAMSGVCGGSCGGIAYIDVFNTAYRHAYYQPAWIFPQSLANDSKSIAEAVSHEVGHTLGLHHDGVDGTSYYGGHDTWAPIMGVGYSRPITQWSRGEYAGATNSEDDLGTIAENGAPLLVDEAGGATTSAARLTTGTAYITSASDVDVFALGTCSGLVTVSAEPGALSPNLDLKVTLLKGTGSVAANDPPSKAGKPARDVAIGLDATVTADVSKGSYFVAVDGVGNGTPTTGYSDYASVGDYRLRLAGACSDSAATPSEPLDPTASVTYDSRSATVRWTVPSSTGSSAIAHYVVTRSGGATVTTTDLDYTFSGLVPGKAYSFTVAAVNTSGTGPASGAWAATPNKPGKAGSRNSLSGPRGGKVTAVARWRPPLVDGGARVSGYRVYGYRLSNRGRVVQRVTSSVRSAGSRSWQPTLHRGRWKFAVRARNSVGWGPISTRSRAVTAR